MSTNYYSKLTSPNFLLLLLVIAFLSFKNDNSLFANDNLKVELQSSFEAYTLSDCGDEDQKYLNYISLKNQLGETTNEANLDIQNGGSESNLKVAYQLADCDNEKIFYDAYMASKNKLGLNNSTASSEKSMILDTCDECPEITFASLQGVAGFPQVDDLSLCGVADTVSILVYNAGECPIGNVVLTVNFDTGLSYGGILEEENGKSIVEFDVSDPSNPKFLISAMDSAEVYIMNFGLTADCDVDFGSTDPLNFDISYEYTYENTASGTTTCKAVEPEIGNFNNGIKVPVLNIISVTPVTRSITASETNGCQTIRIRQDGLGAKLSNFNFSVCGYNDDYEMTVLRTSNPNVNITNFSIDPVTGDINAELDGSHFVGIGNNDEILNANEVVSVFICYQVEGCIDDPMVLDYKATYGCNGKTCAGGSSIQGAVQFVPVFGANVIASANEVTYGGICGEDVSFGITIQSENDDPIDGLWQDLKVKYEACLANGISLVDLMVNGVSLPPSLYTVTGVTVEVDMTMNTDPAFGLIDNDGDGFYNDLPGGAVFEVTTVLDIGCSDSMAVCDGSLACTIDKIEVQALRNCGQPFQEFGDLPDPISFFYGEVSSMTNASIMAGLPIPVSESFVTTACVWNPMNNGLAYSYDFGFENITECANPGDTKLVINITSAGNRINNIRYEAGSATYQGAAVPANGDWVVDPTTGDTIAYEIEVLAGDPAAVTNDYFVNLEIQGDCFPDDYAYVTYKVVEECNDCGGAIDPCEIIKSCNSAAFYVEWNGKECPCFVEAYIDTLYRLNYGYADKAMTQKLTIDDVPEEDRTRFLPGDSIYIRSSFRILDADAMRDAYALWLFRILPNQNAQAAPLMPDVENTNFLGWYIEDGTTGAITEIGIPDCLLAYDDLTRSDYNYPSLKLTNVGVDSRGTFGDATVDSYNTCLNDPNINPNYPPETAVNYETAYLGTGFNGGEMRLGLYFDQGDFADDCGTELNTCQDEFFDQFDLDDGDIIHFDVQSIMMHSPYADLDALNGTGLSSASSFIPSFIGYGTRPDNCGLNTAVTSCNFSTPYQAHVPGPVTVSGDVVVTDCDSEVTYNFNLQDPLPALAAGELPWFANEYRPYMATEYLQLQFPNNMVYLGDGVIIMPDGTEVAIPSANIDPDYGNLVCIPDGSGGVCCVAADTTELAALQINDDDFYVGMSLLYSEGANGPNETNDGCDVNQLIHQKGDPFPHMMVGGAEECTDYGLRYNLASLCPEEVSSGDFKLAYQFAEPYVPSLPGIISGGISGAYGTSSANFPNRPNNIYPMNPYGEACGTAGSTGTGCIDFFGLIDPDPILSPEATNPMRQTGVHCSAPGDFTDNSMNFPPLSSFIADILIADEAGVNESNIYEVCAADNGVDMGVHTNVATSITLPNSVSFISALDGAGAALTATVASSTATHTTYSIAMPDLAPGECFTLEIITELLFCPIGLDIDTEICIATTSGCIDGVKAAELAASGASACTSVSDCYNYIAEAAELQAEWLPTDLEEVPLCSVIPLETVIKNVRLANLVDIETMWWYPAGLHFVPGTWEVCYPGGPNFTGPCFPIPDPTPDATQNNVFGTYFEYTDDQIWSSVLAGDPINSMGLPGTLSSLDSNFVKFKFDTETVCDEFISGTSITFQADAADPCEQRVGTGFVPSPPIIINGANPADFAQFFVFADPVDANCGTESFLTLTYLNTSPLGVTDNSMVCMDIETSTFAYTPGSVTLVSPAGYTPTFTESTNGSITHICFDIPDGIGPGQVFQTGFSFTVPEDIGCGEQDLGVQVSSELMSQSCMAQGIECSVGVLNSVNPVININFLPPVTVEMQDLKLGCSTTAGKVEVCYNVELVNNGGFYSNDIDLALVYDVDQNGQIDDFDEKLDSIMEPVLIPAGDTIMLSGCFEVDADKSCPVIFMVMQETNCVCDAQEFYFDDLKPDLGLGGQKDFPVCPGEPFSLANCGDWTYNLIPAANGTITETADSVFVTLADGASEVMLEVQGTAGQCGLVGDTITISSLMDFELGPFASVAVCSDACTVLNANIPIEYQSNVTVQWVPSTYLDDPTSFKPIACNVTEDITYTIIATFTSGDATCLFTADVPVIVQDPITTDLFEDAFICETDVTPLEAPAGKDNYFWYEVNPAGDDVVAHVGPSFSPSAPGTYYLDCWNTDDVCHSYSSAFEVKPCVDLALTKTVNPTTPGPYSNGSTITYDITVYNQSTTVDVFNVYVKDYFPECLVLNDPDWSLTTAPTGTTNGEAVIVSPIAFIPANGQQTRTITFTISPTCMSTPIINNSEISSYDDDNDPMTPPAPDEDSTPNDDSATPAETGTNDNVDDENPNMPGSADDPVDSDDYDPAEIEFTACPTLAGEVFIDLNNNGCQDANDTDMVEGVDVTIWTCDPVTGAPVSSVGTVTTGSDGQWSFGGPNPDGTCILDPNAQYTVSFDIPNQPGDLPGDPYVGYEFSTGSAPATCAAGEDDNVDPSTGQAESCFDPDDDDPTDGDADENIDAGISPPCETIGGEVFVDVNDNGCQDAGETMMVEGAVATIWECDPVTGAPLTNMGTDTTAADGSWSFGGVDPITGECVLDHTQTYTVVFEIPNQAGDAFEGYEFSEGTAPAGCAAGEADDVDPATGQAESCYDPGDGDGNDDDTIDAGITPPCQSIGGEVFVDTNNNGCQDAAETTMVEGAVATIWECDPVTGDPTIAVGTATTGADGQWSFGGPDPATGECLLDPESTYTVTFDIPNAAGDVAGDPYVGYELSTGIADATCGAGEADDVDPASGQAETCYDPNDDDPTDGDDDENIDAGISPCETMGGEVFVDANNNGCQDADETTMVEGVEVTIWTCDPVTGEPSMAIGTATTGTDGQWSFGGADPATGECLLEAGMQYTVSFDIPNAAGDVTGDPYVGFELSTGEADATCPAGESDDVDPGTGIANDCFDPDNEDGGDGADDENIDAGISPCETMGGEVFVDANNNGCQDADETTVVEGVEVTIWTCDPITGDPTSVVGTATTGADGQWRFGGADPATGECLLDAGTQYTVSFDIPNVAGDLPGDPYVGMELSTGEADAACPAGESDDVDPDTGIANDCFDPDNEDGGDGADDENIDAGISPCETMGGEVFVDANNNGCQDADETTMVEGVEVTIWECDPNTGDPTAVVGTATTGADGQWSFGGADPATGECLLDAGSQYTVSFDIPNAAGDVTGDPYVGMELSTGEADATCPTGEADDVDPGTGIANDCFDPDNEDGGDGADDENIDAGISPCETMGGEVFVDTNNNGCQDADETTMVEGVEVTIWTCDPNTGDPTAVVGTATTGADGQWSFGGADPATGECLLDAGTQYTVSFDIPNVAGDLPGDPYVGMELSTGVADAVCPAGESDDVDPGTGIATDCYDPDDEDSDDGDDDENIDAGISPCETMGGEVFVDENNNGCQDAGETMMVEGVEVTIWACDPNTGDPTAVVGTATTGADGQWSFGGADPATGECLLDAGSQYTVSFDIPNAAGDVTGDPYVGMELSTGEADATCPAGEADDVDPGTGIANDCFDPDNEDGGDGDDDENIDAGISPCETMGGEVFVDANNNGCQDAGETTMVEGVEVTIWTCDPNTGDPTAVVGTATTGADGQWSFGGADPTTGECLLDAGTQYTVSFDIPNAAGDVVGDPYVGMELSTGEADAACPAGEADDVDPGTGIANDCFDPDNEDGGDGNDDENIDAGISPCESMGGEVFVDANNNGCQDADETTMVEGVEVTIWECNPNTGDPTSVVGTATTGADGQWSFGGADPATGDCMLDAGAQYTVSFDIPNAAGDVAGDPYVGFELSTGEADASCPAGESDDVDPGTGIANDCFDPDNEDGSDGDDDENIDAGISPCETMGGEVFVDANNNGCQDADETTMVEGVEVTIWTCDPITGDPTVPVGTVTTGADGAWSFGGADPATGDCLLDAGESYTVSFDLPNAAGEIAGDPYVGFDFSTESADATCADGEPDDVDEDTGIAENCFDPDNEDGDDGDDDENIDAGISPCESIGGEVFVDTNNNGCQEADETMPVPGVEVTVWACDPITGEPTSSVGTVTTGADGSWSLSGANPETGDCLLDPDMTYSATFDLPDGPGEAFEGYVFSMVDDVACPDTADADDVDPTDGTSGCFDPSDDGAGDDGDEDIDAGIYPCQSLGGTVFYDDNINGCQDNGETAVTEAVGVSLFECGQDPAFDTPVATTTTINGDYEFGLDSPNVGAQVCLDENKSYFVVFDIPSAAGEDLEGYVFTDGEDTCAAPSDADDVNPETGESECFGPGDGDGDDDEDIDAGIFSCQNLEGVVFYDSDNNGCQEGNESVVTIEVSVTLYECGQTPGVDTPVATTMTMDGEYEFGQESMNEGADVCLQATKTYFVVFDLPNDSPADPLYGFEFTTNEGACAGPELEDDIDPTNGMSGCYNPDEGDGDDGDDHVDAGIYPCQELGGEVFFDVSNNGCQDNGDNPIIEGVTVELYECGQTPGVDTPVGTTTTVDGQYEFGQDADDPNAQVCLEPGTQYFVQFDIPNGVGEALQGWGLSTNDDFCVGEGTSDDVDPATGNSECYDPDGSDGDDDDHIDAGLFECEDIGGTVFYDMNNNGCQDEGETAVTEEIGVTLYECDAGAPGGGTPVASTTTINGEYEFGAFSPNEGAMVCLEPAKEYYVVFDIPNAPGEELEHWNFSSHEETCDSPDAADDIDPTTGQSDCYDPEDAGDDGDDDGDNDDGDGDNHIDAGIYPCEEVSGEVFFDFNGNGCMDGDDTLVTDPVGVSIFRCGDDPAVDPPVASTMTINGEYEFGVESENPDADVCLDPFFDYTIVFDIPNGPGEAFDDMGFSEGEETCGDSSSADDVDPETGQSECYDAGDDDGDGDEDIDAGIDPCAEIAGELFYDNNNNGCQDEGESLVMETIGVSVYECGQIPGEDDPVASTTTSDGEYEFGIGSDDPGADVCLDPAKDYFVVFDIPNADGEALDNFVFSSDEDTETCDDPSNADDVDPLTGQTDCTDPDGDGSDDMDGGIYECQDLSGEIFLDVNNNGCQDNGEELVTEAVTVEIFECDASGNPAGQAVGSITTTDGMYEFGLDSDDVGGDVCLDPSKTYSVTFSFDNSEGAPLQGHNFSGNSGGCAGPEDSSDVDPSTGSSGCFNPNDDDNDDGDDDDHVDAAINPCQEISGEVFYDIAGDGCEDGNDSNVLEEVIVTLYECNNGTNSGGTQLARTTTIDGAYTFGEESPNENAQVCLQSDRQYYVVFDIPNAPGEALDNYVFTNGSGSDCSGTEDSNDVDPFNGRSDCYGPDDSDGDDDDHIDAGIIELACIGNFVWHDLDGNGTQDAGEPGLRNVIVRLYDGDGNIVSVTSTDSNGFYLFDRLYPGDYYLEFSPPNQYPLRTDPNQGNDGELDSDIDDSNGPNTTSITTLVPGECDLSWDAGFYNCVPIGELVWYDVDMDNVWDDRENGINGLEVTLFRNVNGTWKEWETKVTGHKPGTPSDDGYYKFCAPPGEYYIHIDLPPYGLVPVRSNVGNDELRDSDFDDSNGPGTTSSFTVLCDEERCDIGAGFYPMATVGDIVWMDDNADGVRQPSEDFASGVLVEAYDIYNDMVGSAVTNSSGQYKIEYLREEGYYIRIEPPSGYTVTNANMGSDESMDSDIDHSNGNYTTQYYEMAPGVHMPNVDAGLVAGVALPVELLSFTGQYRPDFVYLSWATASEINTEYFQIEKRHESDDEFVSIGRQIAKGSDSKYDMNDYDVVRSGTYYYRLRSLDNDGSEQLSEVISVDIRRDEQDDVSIYPNPAVSDVNIEISLGTAKEVNIDIYDTEGKLIRAGAYRGRLEAGVINKVIEVQDIPAGVYNVQIQLGTEVLTRKLILLKN